MVTKYNAVIKQDSGFDPEQYLWQEINKIPQVKADGFESVQRQALNAVRSGKTDSDAYRLPLRVLDIVDDLLVYPDAPDLWLPEMVRIKETLPVAFVQQQVQGITPQGTPKYTTGASGDAPRVTYTIDQQSYKVGIQHLALDYKWIELNTIIEAQKSSLLSSTFDLLNVKMTALRDAMMTYEQFKLLLGDRDHEIYGLLDHPHIPLTDYTSTFDPFAQTVDQGTELKRWFTEIIKLVEGETNENVNPNKAIIPRELEHTLNDTYRRDDSAKELIRKSFPNLELYSKIEARSDYLERYKVLTPSTNKHRMTIGEFTERNVDIRVSPFVYNPWVAESEGYARVVHKAHRSVIVTKPEKFRKIQFAVAS